MARLFDISTTTDVLNLDPSGRGAINFTVSNLTGKPLRGTLRVQALDSGQTSWVAVTGESERDFGVKATQVVEVRVTLPASAGLAPGSRFRIRLDALSVNTPEEDFTEGPEIAVVIPQVAAVKPKSLWWVWLVIGLVLLIVIGVVVWLVKGKKTEGGGEGAASGVVAASQPASTAPPPPPPPSQQPPPPHPASVTREFNDPRVGVPEGNLPLDVCLTWGANCGKPAADAFCRANGMSGAVDFRIAADSPPTVVIATKQVCRDAGCDRITWVKCTQNLVMTPFILNRESMRILKSLPAEGKQVAPQ